LVPGSKNTELTFGASKRLDDLVIGQLVLLMMG